MMLSRRYLIATIALAWMLAASACGGTDTRDEEPGEWTPCMCPEKNPRLRAPERIAFANVRAGGAVDEVVELRNEGDEILEIAEIGVSEGDEDELREFRPADDWPAQTQIAAGESIELGITYAPKNGETDTGHLWLETNDPREEKQHAEISLQAQDMSPRLVVSSEVVFSAVKPGSESSQRLTVQNQGQSALQLDKIRRTGSNTFGVRRSDGAPVSTVEGAVLQPGDSVDLQVSFVPEDDAPEYGELILHTDDSERPQTTVQLSGNTGTPCLAVSPSERLRFGTHAVATPATETVSLGNCRPNEADLTIRRIEMTDDGGGVFEIDRESIPGALADGEEYVVEGDEQVDFQVDYEPGSKRLHRGELTVVTDDPARRHHEIELVGRGTSDESCPEAVARASVTGRDRQGTDIETLPRETIQFDGTASSDWDGTVERFVSVATDVT
ncbi:MAG: choice-of-anchor D domain-containing protein, partial [Bradymonadaceae bacterium]